MLLFLVLAVKSDRFQILRSYTLLLYPPNLMCSWFGEMGVVRTIVNNWTRIKFSYTDPYVKLYLVHKGKRQSKWKTTIKRNTLLPVFNESFQFDVKDMDLKNLHLEVLVMDHDRFRRNDIMGVVYIGPNSPQECGRSHWSEMMVSMNSSVSRWHPLLPRHEARTVHKHLDTRMLKRMKSRSL